MSPASKSKSKDKRTIKEPPKSVSKPSGPSNSSAYNPLSGTFHSIETLQNSSALPLQANGHFRNIDETDEHGGSNGTEYDSISNNGSWSGESEDHKEKSSNPPARQESIPPGPDNDKREKIRQKNEKKHQRQKERRAQELHERCSGYLMSRKLEALAEQLVAMGFSHERATMALMLNEGKVEESVSWLFEGGEDAENQVSQKLTGANLKIDISEELGRIADMEVRYKCSKQEVERAVVSLEGDLEKAAEVLQKQKQDASSGLPNVQETGDPPTFGNGQVSVSQNLARLQSRPTPTQSALQRRDERDSNYTKLGDASAIVGPSEPGAKAAQPVKRVPPKLEWAKPQHATLPAEKRWPVSGPSPSVSYSLAAPSTVHALPSRSKVETHHVVSGVEVSNLQAGSIREPIIMMQRPQSTNSKQVSSRHVGSLSGSGSSWYPTNGIDMKNPNGAPPQFSSTGNRNLTHSSHGGSTQVYNPLQCQQQEQLNTLGSGFREFPRASHVNAPWNRIGVSPTLAAVSSLGLFSGLGSSASSGAASPVDWTKGGSTIQLDYTNIDWTLDYGLPSSRHGTLWLGLTGFMRSNGQDFRGLGVESKSAMRSAFGENGVSPLSGLQDAGGETSAMGSREWASPFEEKDLYSLPRRFVSSPPL